MSNLPRVNWPVESGRYRVIQAELDGLLYLRFQDRDAGQKTHEDVLLAFLREAGIEGYPLTRSGKPHPVGERYKVGGMGEAKVDVESRYAAYSGTSYGYGMGIDIDHIDAVARLETDWKIEREGVKRRQEGDTTIYEPVSNIRSR